MKFTTKLGFKIIQSDPKVLYPIYLLFAVFVLAIQLQYYEAYGPDSLKISSFLLWFCVAWTPVVILISIVRFNAAKKFIENGIEVWGHVLDTVRGQFKFKKLGKIAFGYTYLDNSYYKKIAIRFVREFKDIASGDRICLVIDPNNPNDFLLLGI